MVRVPIKGVADANRKLGEPPPKNYTPEQKAMYREAQDKLREAMVEYGLIPQAGHES